MERVKVLLYSGGLDSYALSKLYNFNTVLFIRTGTRDNEIEYQKIRMGKDTVVSEIVDMTFLKKWELPNKIIPLRNLFFASAAAQYGNDIYLGATKGDSTRDKDEIFSHMTSALFSYFSLGDPEKTKFSGSVNLITPFRDMTKRQIVALYIARNYDPQDLVWNSLSCYYPLDNGYECGKCRSCLRKYVALKLNSVQASFKPSIQDLELLLIEAKEKNRQDEILDIEETLWKEKSEKL
jgi:7-cyano-7-deazaguanine synthase